MSKADRGCDQENGEGTMDVSAHQLNEDKVEEIAALVLDFLGGVVARHLDEGNLVLAVLALSAAQTIQDDLGSAAEDCAAYLEAAGQQA